MRKIIFLIGILGSCFVSANIFAAYPKAEVHNHTKFTIGGHVKYASALCKDDYYKVKPGKKWKAKSRGTCLITSVTGKVHTTNGKKPATTKVHHYSSSGTSYHKFYVVKQKENYHVMSDHQLKGDSAQSYPLVKVENHTLSKVTGTVEYSSAFCSNDPYSVGPAKTVKGKLVPTTWMAKSRGVCLVNKITAHDSDGVKIQPYSSIGTSYGKFQIRHRQSGARVFSTKGWNEINASLGKGPGFYIHNKTDWPVAFSLDQAGCFYYDVVDSGENFVRETGSVWFTIKANIVPDGKSPVSDTDCIEPVAEIVGSALVFAATGGLGAFAEVGEAGAAFFAEAGVEAGAEAGLEAGAEAGAEASAEAEAEAGAEEEASAEAEEQETLKQKIYKQGKVSLKRAAFSNINRKTFGEMILNNGSLELKGQYAGYAWPFRCDTMPKYELTGGPTREFNDAGEVTFNFKNETFTLKKVNDCGDDMMGSKKAEAKNNHIINASDATLSFKHMKSYSISGYNNKHLKNVTPNECMKACTAETTFVCRSFDYYNKSKACDLSTAHGSEKKNDGSYDYYELKY